ncbi:MAG: hypothetical protein IPM32_11080 [Ignavibacteriae bacterium]|nr:hypothetical protein [Ignavibacteriota bacterium]
MNLFENINISISGNPIFLFLGLLIILVYSFYIYKKTLPKINLFLKSILIFLRTASLFLIFILLFDPVVTTTTKEINEPVNLFFIDNSKSVRNISSGNDIKKVREIFNEFSNVDFNNEFYSFGNKVKNINSFDSIFFNNSSTQFDDIFKLIKQMKNVSSAIILSDGINNQGSNPVNTASELGIPIFTIGLGDTTIDKDIEIQKITTNEFIYTDRETDIEVLISNKNLSDQNSIIQLIENGKIIAQQEIKLSETGINRILFPFKTNIEGEHKIIVNSILKGEEKNKNNNSKTVLINVLAAKKKITILSGGPSSDLSIITSTLSSLEDYELHKIIQLSENKFLNDNSDLKLIKSSDVIFLIGFPSKSTNLNFLKDVFNEITNHNKPIFFVFSNNIDLTKLNSIKNFLPFNYSNISNGFSESQVSAQNVNYSIIGNEEETENWKNFPPINFPKTKIIPSVESQILLVDQISKQPVMFLNTSKNKFIVLTAANIWKWQIQNFEKQNLTFDNLLINSIKWLSLNADRQKFSLKTQKKIFSIGEKVIFNANYYDDTFEPIIDANLEIEIQHEKSSQKIILNPIGNGIYETELTPNFAGTYNYKIQSENKNLNFSSTFFVEQIELESLEKKSDRNFLRELSNSTNGKYFDINSINGFQDEIKTLFNNKISYNFIDNELRISFLHLILLMIVLLFSIEWILRKALRML